MVDGLTNIQDMNAKSPCAVKSEKIEDNIIKKYDKKCFRRKIEGVSAQIESREVMKYTHILLK